MAKKRPYLIEVSLIKSVDVLSFGENKTDATRLDMSLVEDLVDTYCFDDNVQVQVIKEIKSLSDIPNYIYDQKTGWVDMDTVFGLKNGETIFDYFKEEAKKEEIRRIDENNHHFGFWEETKSEKN